MRTSIVKSELSLSLDILLARRLWNGHSITYNTMQYAMFRLVLDIRGKDSGALAVLLTGQLSKSGDSFASNDRLQLHGRNYFFIKNFLARITDFLEVSCGMPSRYVEYMTANGKNRYEIEHIWADKPERHIPDEFSTRLMSVSTEIGLETSYCFASRTTLVLGISSMRTSCPITTARTCSQSPFTRSPTNTIPRFWPSRTVSGLPFEAHKQFKKDDLDKRQVLYTKLAERIWSPDRLAEVVG